jgi:CheY-like chemotaxis protein
MSVQPPTEPSVRTLVTELLEDLGYTALEAGDVPAALKVLQSDERRGDGRRHRSPAPDRGR